MTITAQDYSTNRTTNLYSVVVSNLVNRSLQYDANGNLTNDGTRGYVYDGADRVTQITEGTNSVSFSYDGLSRRVQLAQNGTSNKFLWCATEICEQRDAAGGTVQKQYFPQGVRDSNTNYFYAKDHLGSIREVTDTNQALHARYDYDPYGRRTKISGSFNADFGFTGYYHLQPSWMTDGLNLPWYRIYLPELGRFGSRDPLGEIAGLNLYGYVYNNPTVWRDPFGLDTWTSFQDGVAAGGYQSNFGGWTVGGRWGTPSFTWFPPPYYQYGPYGQTSIGIHEGVHSSGTPSEAAAYAAELDWLKRQHDKIRRELDKNLGTNEDCLSPEEKHALRKRRFELQKKMSDILHRYRDIVEALPDLYRNPVNW